MSLKTEIRELMRRFLFGNTTHLEDSIHIKINLTLLRTPLLCMLSEIVYQPKTIVHSHRIFTLDIHL